MTDQRKMAMLGFMTSAKAILMKFGKVEQIVLAESEDKLIAIPLDCIPDELQSVLVAKAVHQFNCTIVYHIAEAWVAVQHDKDDWRPASERDDREECIIVVSKSKDGDYKAIQQVFSRDAEVKPVFKEEPKWFGADIIRCRVLNSVFEEKCVTTGGKYESKVKH